MAPDMTRAFETAINWLELDSPLSGEVRGDLMGKFAQAVGQFNTHLHFWSEKISVQVMGGKAVAIPIRPDEQGLSDWSVHLDSYTSLGIPRHGMIFFENLSDEDSKMLRDIIDEEFESAPPERRMRFGA